MINLTILKQEKYQVEFKPSQLRINATAIINMWGGGQTAIQMDYFNLDLENIKNEQDLINQIKENANDGGFGCESIEYLIDVQVDVLSNSDLGTFCTDSFFYNEINL